MPTDPRTGQRLPGKAGLYAGEPGAPADAPPMPTGADGAAGAAGAAPTGQDLIDKAGQVDQILSEEEMATLDEAGAAMGGDMPPEGAPPAEGEMPAEGGADMAPIIDMLGVTPERAQEIYDAAQQMPQLAGLPVEELASMLAADIDLRMRVEALAAGESDRMAEEEAEAAMAEEDAGGEMPPVPM